MTTNSGLRRRKFCQIAAGAALGTASLPPFFRMAYAENEDGEENRTRTQKEGRVDKKISHIEVKVKSVKGACGIHKVGDSARISEQGVDGKICIHALYSLLPAAFAMLYEARFPWLTANPDQKTHACPDAANPVVFEITRVREG
jgi:uncharacterized repeat protein (TIGR04076 family)